jgi:hypothetical protein
MMERIMSHIHRLANNNDDDVYAIAVSIMEAKKKQGKIEIAFLFYF